MCVVPSKSHFSEKTYDLNPYTRSKYTTILPYIKVSYNITTTRHTSSGNDGFINNSTTPKLKITLIPKITKN